MLATNSYHVNDELLKTTFAITIRKMFTLGDSPQEKIHGLINFTLPPPPLLPCPSGTHLHGVANLVHVETDRVTPSVLTAGCTELEKQVGVSLDTWPETCESLRFLFLSFFGLDILTQ